MNNESEMNIVIRINACEKKLLLALVLVHSIVVGIIFGISLTILVMVAVEVVVSGGLDPILLIKLTLALLLTLGSNCQRRYYTLTLGIAYLILYLIYSGSTSFT